MNRMKHKETNALTMFRSWRGCFLVFFFLFFLFSSGHPLGVHAQFRTDRLIISGQIAYDNQDYVVAMQHFNHVLSGKPYLYEPWYYRGLCKLQLDDYVGAESDFNKAIELNPYIHQLFSARAESRIRQQKYAEAIDDYERALKLYPDQKGYWYNRAYCRFFMKDLKQTHEDLDYIVKRWPDLNNAYSLQTEAIAVSFSLKYASVCKE